MIVSVKFAHQFIDGLKAVLTREHGFGLNRWLPKPAMGIRSKDCCNDGQSH
jgi:hypothetical protein